MDPSRSSHCLFTPEVEAFAGDVVELALDHVHDNEVARAYDRGERFTQRVELFNWWGEKLAAAQHGAKIIALPRGNEVAV